MADHGSDMGSQPTNRSIFGEDGKLSSASAAASLKYAKPQDLPSFPSAGLQMSSAGAAASLASSNRKSFEHWKPDPIPAANKAALLAKDYEMEPLWQPQASAAGSKAAMLAHSNTAKNNAATEDTAPRTRTMANTRPISSTAPAPPPTMHVPAETHKKALMAATASHNRTRSGSAPQPIDKSTKDSQWALKAATQSHKAGPTPISAPFTTGDPGFEAARIQNIAKNNVDRRLYTSAPPVAIEVQEKNRQDMLKASAIAMAQKMYAIQQRQFEEAAGKSASDGQALAASRARSSTIASSTAGDDIPMIGGGYENLEEAARKLAQERLAKIHDEHAEYRNYYVQQSSPPRSRMSTRMRGRASSGADADDSDEEDSRRIRSQMSIFQSKLAEVDNKKRQQDRDNLLEIAHRNVDARIRQMDDKVFQQTGKASPAQMEQWEKSARDKAQKDSDERMKYAGKVHIGGGKYLDQSELDAIAKARLQPTLDEISEKAERMRAKDEADRLERERLQAEAQAEKARQAETAAALKKIKEQQKQEEKARRDEEKRVLREQQAAEKQKRDEEKRALKEQQQAEKEEKRRSKETKPRLVSTIFGGGAATGAAVGATEAETSTAGPTTTATAEKPGVLASVPYEQIPDGQTFHDQVTSPTALAEQTTVLTQASTHDRVTSPVASSTSHEQVPLPKVLTLTPDPEPSTASPANVQVVPTTTTTTTTTTTEAARPSVEAEKMADNRKSIESENEYAQSPTKSSSGIKSWMKVKFGSGRNAQKEKVTPSTQTTTPATRDDSGLKATSMHDVAMAGKSNTNEMDDMYAPGEDVRPPTGTANTDTVRRSPSISSLSSSAYSGENAQPREARALNVTHTDSEGEDRGRQGFKQRLLKKVKPKKSKTTDTSELVQSNTTEDEFEEARDTFEEEKLAPPPPSTTLAGEGKGTRGLSPKNSREGSKFTEEL